MAGEPAMRIRITQVFDDALGPQLEAPMMRLGNALGRRMQRLVPKRTWRLHDSITKPKLTRRGDRVKVEVGVGGKMVGGKFVGYHLLVERGTSKAAAQPFMRPALLQTTAGDLRFSGSMAEAHGTAAERRAVKRASNRSKKAGA